VPSNVTTRIQQLEAEIGIPLFQRDKKRMTLTNEGQTIDTLRDPPDLAERCPLSGRGSGHRAGTVAA
jgi:hypothetical protein